MWKKVCFLKITFDLQKVQKWVIPFWNLDEKLEKLLDD
jgi:hypothetical protein